LQKETKTHKNTFHYFVKTTPLVNYLVRVIEKNASIPKADSIALKANK
jgi:hypothetical protein